MKNRIVSMIAAALLLPMAACSITSCESMGGVGQVDTDAQAWLNDPKNQALIQEIAAAANIIIGAFGEHRGGTTNATAVGKLAVQFPNVPAGAIATIARNPKAYLKK